MSQHNFCNSGQNVIFRVWGLLCLLCFLKLPSTSNKQTKPQTFLFPLISYLNIYSCGIFHIKGEVGKGLKNLSSTNHFFSAHPPFPFFGGGTNWAPLYRQLTTVRFEPKDRFTQLCYQSLLVEPFGATTPDLQGARKREKQLSRCVGMFIIHFLRCDFPILIF